MVGGDEKSGAFALETGQFSLCAHPQAGLIFPGGVYAQSTT